MDFTSESSRLRTSCVEYLGESDGAAVAGLARRGFRIETGQGDGGATAGCRLGGPARLEPGTPWPEYKGIPLSLFAVLDTGVLASWLGAELPCRPGLLNFFCLADDCFEGWEVAGFRDPGVGRVVPADPAGALETPGPDSVRTYERRPVRAVPILTIPELMDVPIPGYGPGEGKWSEYMDLHEQWDERTGGGHRAFGWPWELNAALDKDDAHLLQLDSDEQWQWGDVGVLYFRMPAEALRAGDFSRAGAEMASC
jgi:hypothetical protein